MKAIGKNLIIQKISEEVTTESGLLLSNEDVQDMRYHKGKVTLPGSDVSEFIKSGDEIYYDSRQSYTLVIDGEYCTIIQERDVVVVL
jgi:co-chaperonin GroES (HSP10)|tara:strand:- start:536 stop:796 length:261 start_codon:yes stop_codon:yes gene_type:complete